VPSGAIFPYPPKIRHLRELAYYNSMTQMRFDTDKREILPNIGIRLRMALGRLPAWHQSLAGA
jgi:hypothetical protein